MAEKQGLSQDTSPEANAQEAYHSPDPRKILEAEVEHALFEAYPPDDLYLAWEKEPWRKQILDEELAAAEAQLPELVEKGHVDRWIGKGTLDNVGFATWLLHRHGRISLDERLQSLIAAHENHANKHWRDEPDHRRKIELLRQLQSKLNNTTAVSSLSQSIEPDTTIPNPGSLTPAVNPIPTAINPEQLSKESEKIPMVGEIFHTPDGMQITKGPKIGLGGSTSKVYAAEIKTPNGVSEPAVLKRLIMTGDLLQGSQARPEALLADAAVLEVGIPGTPRLFAAGWVDGHILNPVLADPNDLTFQSQYDVVMEQVPTGGLDSYYAECIYFDRTSRLSDSTRESLTMTPQQAEAIMLSKMYYATFVPAKLNDNGWSVPYDFSYEGSNINFDLEQKRFTAIDFGMSEPIARETALKMVQRLGGEGIFDNIHKRSPEKFPLEGTYKNGRSVAEAATYSRRFQRKSQLAAQIIRGLPSNYRGSTIFATAEEAMEVFDNFSRDNPRLRRIYDILSEVFDQPESEQGWQGLEESFRRILQTSEKIDPQVREFAKEILTRTGIEAFKKI